MRKCLKDVCVPGMKIAPLNASGIHSKDEQALSGESALFCAFIL